MNNFISEGVTAITFRHVERWKAAKNNVKRIRAELNRAEVEEANASIELGERIVPEGQNNEPFNIWIGSGILCAVRSSDGRYAISWRKEPDGKDRLEHGV